MKITKKLSCIFATLFFATFTPFLHAEDVATSDLKLLPEGAAKKVGFYSPQHLQLSADKPATLTKAPPMTAPLYGELKFAGKSYLVALDEPDGKDAMLYVDANNNGDLTDDAPTVWAKRPSAATTQPQLTMYLGSFKLPLSLDNNSANVQLLAYRFDKNDPKRPMLKNTLLYYRDYGYDGTIKLNGTEYHAMLMDLATTGDFQSKGAKLLVDINGNGKFDATGERFAVDEPFNIKGTAWKLTDLTSAGSFKIAKSEAAVAEVAAPPNLSAGSPAVSFKAQKMDGTPVNFPSDYKGKIVILDFWATWCGPCMGEVPGLVTAYDQYHPKGVEVLGISLDQPDNTDKVKTVTVDHKMTWPQVYDGKYWSAAVAQLYGIDSIPHPFLIDGDTGKILAEGNSLRGDALAGTLQTALDEKAKATAK
jgi:peroxiredoxin